MKSSEDLIVRLLCNPLTRQGKQALHANLAKQIATLAREIKNEDQALPPRSSADSDPIAELHDELAKLAASVTAIAEGVARLLEAKQKDEARIV